MKDRAFTFPIPVLLLLTGRFFEFELSSGEQRMLPIRRHLQSDGASDVSHNNGTLTVGPDPDVTSSACVSEIPSPHQKEYVNHDSTPDDIVSQVGTEIHPGSSVSCTNNEQRRQVSYPMQADFGDAEFIEDTDEDTNALSSEQGLEVVDPHSQPIVFRSIVPFDFLVPRSLIRLSWSLWNQKWQPWLSSSSLELFIARWEHSETDSLDCENNRERPFRIENGRWISTTPVIRVQITSAKRHFKCTLIDSKLAAKEATFEEEFMSYEIKTWVSFICFLFVSEGS